MGSQGLSRFKKKVEWTADNPGLCLAVRAVPIWPPFLFQPVDRCVNQLGKHVVESGLKVGLLLICMVDVTAFSVAEPLHGLAQAIMVGRTRGEVALVFG